MKYKAIIYATLLGFGMATCADGASDDPALVPSARIARYWPLGCYLDTYSDRAMDSKLIVGTSPDIPFEVCLNHCVNRGLFSWQAQ